MNSSLKRNADLIKAEAARLGFGFCGISKAEFLADEAPRLEEWLKRKYQGKMSYLENHFEKRLDPTLLVPGARSVVSLLYNYYPKTDLANHGSLKIAKYAYREDYHFVVKEKLQSLLIYIRDNIGQVEGRAFVDSAPVMERAWAQRSGLGWIGKNTLLLNREVGSFFFLAELIIDLELQHDHAVKDYCGTCTACIDACPTDAIPAAGIVDGSMVRFGSHEFCAAANDQEIGAKTSPHERDMSRITKAIKQAARQADYVMLSIHTHEMKSDRKEEPADFIVEFARACIDAGAHAVRHACDSIY